MRPGRHCPLHYRYAPAALAASPELTADALYVVGGLYGNLSALEALLDLAAREPGPVTMVFNGDFHWFDIDERTFDAINCEVLRHTALRGNVETEIAGEDDGAGCGCAYPDWVAEGEVARSNAISDRLRETARTFPAARAALGALPMYLRVRVGGIHAGIVHGDAHSLAGWDYAQERLAGAAADAALARDFAETDCRIIASSHTCLPVATDCLSIRGRCVLVNNGAAGMPNFRATHCGVITRIGLAPAAHVAPIYATQLDCVHIEALPLHYDHARWRAAFFANWPAGSPAYRSYFHRIEHGPRYEVSRAARWRAMADGAAPTGMARGRIAT